MSKEKNGGSQRSQKSANEVLLNIERREVRCAHLKNGQLQDLTIERAHSRNISGNIYRGVVTHCLQGIQSAFIDIGEEMNGFIHFSDADPGEPFSVFESPLGEEVSSTEGPASYGESQAEQGEIQREIQEIKQGAESESGLGEVQGEGERSLPDRGDNAKTPPLHQGQLVLVQVLKEAMGKKGARLTSNVSLSGRYLVLLPNRPGRELSRKVVDSAARRKLKRWLKEVSCPEEAGIICRTLSQEAAPSVLDRELQTLSDQWNRVVEQFHGGSEPGLLSEDTPLVQRTFYTAIDRSYSRILIDDHDTYQTCRKMLDKHLLENPRETAGVPLSAVEFYRDTVPMFERFGIEKEIHQAMESKVWLPGGGYLVFDTTEAMHTIDVNSGGSNAGGTSSLEEVLVRINLDAVHEIMRQIRIRNLGGLIVIDFIDMFLHHNRRRVLKRLKELVVNDESKITFLPMNDFCIVQMTRQRLRESLQYTMHAECPYCNGSGRIKNRESVLILLERTLRKCISHYQQYGISIHCHPHMYEYIHQSSQGSLEEFAADMHARLEFEEDPSLRVDAFVLYSMTSGERLDEVLS